jgi:hypothetical protein
MDAAVFAPSIWIIENISGGVFLIDTTFFWISFDDLNDVSVTIPAGINVTHIFSPFVFCGRQIPQ